MHPLLTRRPSIASPHIILASVAPSSRCHSSELAKLCELSTLFRRSSERQPGHEAALKAYAQKRLDEDIDHASSCSEGRPGDALEAALKAWKRKRPVQDINPATRTSTAPPAGDLSFLRRVAHVQPLHNVNLYHLRTLLTDHIGDVERIDHNLFYNMFTRTASTHVLFVDQSSVEKVTTLVIRDFGIL
ncbi:hypothetical protein BD626DRAFT_485111, partial [Schizophyllum amplum]